MLRLRRLPTTQRVFSQLTVLLFGYCFLVLCISQTGRRADAVPTSWFSSYVYTLPGGNVGIASHPFEIARVYDC